jgi:tetratricopeptide (TPR) repeat protein
MRLQPPCLVLVAVGAALASSFALAEEPGAEPSSLPSSAPSPEPVVESHPGISVESSYSEAVLAFNTKNYDQVLKVLDALLARVPEHVESLELQALTLKTKGDDDRALETYAKLLKLKPDSESGPYHFESGVILFRKKKNAEAKAHFEKALALNFNAEPCRFFLGIIAFGAGNFGEAEGYFTEVSSNGSDELKVASHFYRGLIDFQNGSPSEGTHEMVTARDRANALLAATKPGEEPSSIAKDIGAAAERTLAPYDAAQWFGSFSLLAGYDGNATLTSATAGPEQASGEKTTEAMVSGTIGRMSSPAAWLQWVPSYRFSYNKNFNSDAKAYEFFANTASLYLTRDALAQTSYGLKLEGSYTFQNVATTDTGAPSGTFNFHPYSFTGELGPYVRTEPAPHWKAEYELYLRPQSYSGETPDTGLERRSGISYFGRATVRHDTPNRWFNPDGSLSYEIYNAQGGDFLSRILTLDLNDAFRLNPKDTVNVGFTLGLASFPDYETGPRHDTLASFHGAWIHVLDRKWSLVGQLGISHNSSSVDTFTYTKPTLFFGASYTL